MGFRFRKSISVMPGVRINLSRRGFSTTIGGRGASINVGQRGTYINTSIPGTGISYRQRVGAPNHRKRYAQQYDNSGPLPTDPYLIDGTLVDFGSADVTKLTSSGLEGVKELITTTRNRKLEIQAEITRAKWQLFWMRTKYLMVLMSLIGFLFGKIRRKIRDQINEILSDTTTLNENLKNTIVAIDFDMESEISAPYRRMESAFDSMAQSQAKWSIQSKQSIDRVRARSWAGTIFKRVPVNFNRAEYPLVQTSISPFVLGTLNRRSVIYIYPGFILMSGAKDFAIIDLIEIMAVFRVSRFQESDRVPNDARVIGQAWAKSNKDGSRDRRFKSNRQIPIVEYGEFKLESETGLYEAYMSSRPQASMEFIQAFNEIKNMLLTQSKLKSRPISN